MGVTVPFSVWQRDPRPWWFPLAACRELLEGSASSLRPELGLGKVGERAGLSRIATSLRPWRFQEPVPTWTGWESRSDPGVRAGLQADGEVVYGSAVVCGLGEGDSARKTWSCQRGLQGPV